MGGELVGDIVELTDVVIGGLAGIVSDTLEPGLDAKEIVLDVAPLDGEPNCMFKPPLGGDSSLIGTTTTGGSSDAESTGPENDGMAILAEEVDEGDAGNAMEPTDVEPPPEDGDELVVEPLVLNDTEPSPGFLGVTESPCITTTVGGCGGSIGGGAPVMSDTSCDIVPGAGMTATTGDC